MKFKETHINSIIFKVKSNDGFILFESLEKKLMIDFILFDSKLRYSPIIQFNKHGLLHYLVRLLITKRISKLVESLRLYIFYRY